MESLRCTGVSNRDGVIIPQFRLTLNALIDKLIKPETLKRELFFALLLIVIKENDFVLKGNTEIDVVDYILASREAGGSIHEIIVVLSPFQETQAKIIGCSLNDTILINAFIDASKEVHSLCLPINQYITTSTLGVPSEFFKQDDLFSSMKQNIVGPMKNSILNYHHQPNSSLSGIPNDVLFHILLGLSVSDILNISESCKRLRKAVKEANLWFRLFKRDFPRMRYNEEDDWQSVYKRTYIQKRKMKLESAHTVRENVIEEIPEYHDDRPVRDSRWEVIL